jgi:hypothetical protein
MGADEVIRDEEEESGVPLRGLLVEVLEFPRASDIEVLVVEFFTGSQSGRRKST